MADANSGRRFVSIWGNAVSVGEARPESYGKDITLRYPVYSAFDGDAVRLTFDNYCGTEQVTISQVSIMAKNPSDDTAEKEFFPVTFRGSRSCVIPAGSRVCSDELSLDVKAGSTFDVSMYLGDYTQLRSCVFTCGALSDGAQFASGNLTGSETFPKELSRPTHYFYFLSNVSLRTDKKNRAVVCYGDSITAQNWPDDLAVMLKSRQIGDTSVIRRATSGSRILREYTCLTYQSYGLKGSRRFAHEVPTDGADTVIIQQGINDIIHPVGTDINPFRPMSDLPTAGELTEGLAYYVKLARSYGYKVYAGTLLPIGGWRTYAPFRETLRNDVNEWIRSTDMIDGVVDFDSALADPEDKTRMLPEYDSGDHLHPSKSGYRKMAQLVADNAAIFEKRAGYSH